MNSGSPCVGVCTLDAMGKYCTGCGRTLQQIADWGKQNANQNSSNKIK